MRGDGRRRPERPTPRDQRRFWGEDPQPDATATPVEPVRPSREPDALVRFLGPPPLQGQEAAAVHYFAAVYDKAVALAGALAAAGGLLELEEPEQP